MKEFNWYEMANRLGRYRFYATCIDPQGFPHEVKRGEVYEIEINSRQDEFCRSVSGENGRIATLAAKTPDDPMSTGGQICIARFVPWVPQVGEEAYFHGLRVVVVSAHFPRVSVRNATDGSTSEILVGETRDISSHELIPAKFMLAAKNRLEDVQLAATNIHKSAKWKERSWDNVNKYPGKCCACGERVDEYKGFIRRIGGRTAHHWQIWCPGCADRQKAVDKELEKDCARKKIDPVLVRRLGIDLRWSPVRTGKCGKCERDMNLNDAGVCLSCFEVPKIGSEAEDLAEMEATIMSRGVKGRLNVVEAQAYWHLVSTQQFGIDLSDLMPHDDGSSSPC